MGETTAMAPVDLKAIERLLTDVAREEIVSRFRNLADGDIREKKPGDLVTEADIRAEERLSRELEAMFPGTIAIGEESVARGDVEREVINGERPVWVMDPVDGTSAFAAGNPRFTTLLTLYEEGRAVATWNQAPMFGRSAYAARGEGAVLDGARVSMRSDAALIDARLLLPPRGYSRLVGERQVRVPVHVARTEVSIGFGVDVFDLLDGTADIAMFGTKNPWELPGGALMIEEAGGVFVGLSEGTGLDRWDMLDSPYIAAASQSLADEMRAVLS